jgi:hypothetical protein
MRRSWVRFPQAAPTFPQVKKHFHTPDRRQPGRLWHEFVMPDAACRGDSPVPASLAPAPVRPCRCRSRRRSPPTGPGRRSMTAPCPDAGAIRRDQPADHHVSEPAGRLDYELVGARARVPGEQHAGHLRRDQRLRQDGDLARCGDLQGVPVRQCVRGRGEGSVPRYRCHRTPPSDDGVRPGPARGICMEKRRRCWQPWPLRRGTPQRLNRQS